MITSLLIDETRVNGGGGGLELGGGSWRGGGVGCLMMRGVALLTQGRCLHLQGSLRKGS